MLLDLTLGRLDAVLGEAPQLDAGFLKTPAGRGLRLLRRPRISTRRSRAAAPPSACARRTPALRDRLSAAIAAIRADGTYQAIGDALLRLRHLRRLSRRP